MGHEEKANHLKEDDLLHQGQQALAVEQQQLRDVVVHATQLNHALRGSEGLRHDHLLQDPRVVLRVLNPTSALQCTLLPATNTYLSLIHISEPTRPY